MPWQNFEEQNTHALSLNSLNAAYVNEAISTYKNLYSLIRFPSFFNYKYYSAMVLMVLLGNRTQMWIPEEIPIVELSAFIAVAWGTISTRREAEKNAAKFSVVRSVIPLDESQALIRQLRKAISEQNEKLIGFIRWGIIIAAGLWAMGEFFAWRDRRAEENFNTAAQEFIKQGVVLVQHPHILNQFPVFVSLINACNIEMENGANFVTGNGRKLIDKTMRSLLSILNNFLPEKKNPTTLFEELKPSFTKMGDEAGKIKWEIQIALLFLPLGIGYAMVSSMIPALVFSALSLFILQGKSLVLQRWRDWRLARQLDIFEQVLPDDLKNIVSISRDVTFQNRLQIKCNSFNTTIDDRSILIDTTEYSPLLIRLLAPFCKHVFVNKPQEGKRQNNSTQEFILVEPRLRDIDQVKIQIDALMLRFFSFKLYADDLRKIFANFLNNQQIAIDYLHEKAPVLVSPQLLSQHQATIINQLLERNFPTHPLLRANQPLYLQECNIGFIRGMLKHCLGLISPATNTVDAAPRRRQIKGGSTENALTTAPTYQATLSTSTWTVGDRTWQWSGFENEKRLGVRALACHGGLIYFTLAANLLKQVTWREYPAVQFLMNYFASAHLIGDYGSGIKHCKDREMENDGVSAEFKLKHVSSTWRLFAWHHAQTQDGAHLYEFRKARNMKH